ncbi:TetR/AcrR family transcriptional regulator [Mycobacterium talmoniae]|uniref:HTH-type transcriptional regulator TtgR n=1 Tax=Mycobacterium talmoniae TaxID=1858794 RepID=A0A1S1NMJ4_9MYCO|nr:MULTISPECIES: TetR/AcrR family transcriptional regulator [Mycobacterium]OHV05230.1 TetR family transcriptional regulator [Mycobacterium talmoniae]PQM45366.1 HTH-type transcriptional regulator TtgR [Mycobacterium talmoniae]TDH48337.1 TetR/AcrR family transcriptional regulator [Mycobacterium eburneum]
MAPKKQDTVTRTQRQQLRTRRQLLDAGRTLIAAKGVSGLRVQEITELADVALGSFYNYFPSKDELVEAIITETLSDLASATITETSDDTDPAEIVAMANVRVIGLARREPDLARLIVNIAHSEALFGQAVHPYARMAVERGIATGRFSVPDVEVLLTAVIGGAFALIREILDGRHQPEAAEAFACYVLASLGVRPDEASAIVTRTAGSAAT